MKAIVGSARGGHTPPASSASGRSKEAAKPAVAAPLKKQAPAAASVSGRPPRAKAAATPAPGRREEAKPRPKPPAEETTTNKPPSSPDPVDPEVKAKPAAKLAVTRPEPTEAEAPREAPRPEQRQPDDAKPATASSASAVRPTVAPGATAERGPVPGRAPPAQEPPPAPPAQLPQTDRPVTRPPAKPEVFQEGDHVVYPTHGVGKVERIAIEEIAGHKLELIHITFEENRMTLRVPVAKARSAGLRKLATRKLFDDAMSVLKGRARVKRTMWSRRAQEYEAKINSGDPLAIAEVVRDLHRNAGQPDQSFSERQIYELAMDRLAAELAALDKTDKTTAATKLSEFLKTV